MGISRRKLIRRGGQAAAGAGGLWLSGGLTGLAPAANAAEHGEKADSTGSAADEATRRITVTQATNASAALSPDGRTVVLDLLNLLWTVPAKGGEAGRLTDIDQEATEPDFSPDGRHLVYQSYTDGNFHLWLARADGTGARQLTKGASDHREPRFSPDGKRIAYAGEADGRYAIHVLDLDSGATKVWAPGKDATAQEAQPFWHPDGTAIAFTSGKGDAPQSIVRVDADGKRTTLVAVTEGRVAGPSFSPDGSRFAYVHLASAATALVVDGRTVSDPAEDVFPFAARWPSKDEVFYTADGKVRRRKVPGGKAQAGKAEDIPFAAHLTVPRVQERPAARDADAAPASTAPRPVKGIVSPSLSPDGERIAFAALGDIWIAPANPLRGKGSPKAVVSDGHLNTDPAWSPDGSTLVYVSDRGGSGNGGAVDLWTYDIADGTTRRLTDLQDAASGPTFSPDGASVAFGLGSGTLHTVDVATGAVRKVAGPLNAPGRPTFSADGRKLSLAALAPVTARYREGFNRVLTVDLASGEAHYDDPVPGKSLVNRIDAGPVHSPDGKHTAYVVGGTLHLSALDAAGRPTGTARRLNGETADCPSWSADSSSLLYLSNGRLRLADARTGRARTVPVKLTWRPAKPSGRTVVQVGAVWDGTSESLRHDVDIVIKDDRIESVVARGSVRAGTGGRTVDARHLTALPGLIAVHEHGPWQRADTMKLWLSFGITAVRSPGTAHYAAVEAKEATASGRRVGPRVFAAGDLIDGSRIYYSSGRPVTDTEELERELDKAEALGHDLVKTYVRLPYAMQRAAIRGGHRRGMRATSHYLFGPLGLGADGTEHLGGTSRYGRRQKETHLGHAYDDMTEPLIASGMSFTPTFGLSGAGLPATRAALYRYAEWAVGDQRLTSLMSEAEYEEFRTGVADARQTVPTDLLAFVARHGATVRRLLEGGAHVGVGTDSPLVPPAVYYHLNLQAMVRYGATPYQALRSATVEGARTLGMSARMGTVEPGKLADLVLVEGDPLSDIRAAAAVRRVVLGGVVHSVDDLAGEKSAKAASTGTASARSAAAVRTASASAEVADVPQGPAREQYWWHREEHAHHTCC
ncbi:amidohydrolase family protein [Streptomyces lonegramiae]|uniref:Amidohydrolase family protein n=1 Tax=Streptomyces lonegramiae TaxID=3075524 RepID=A0ABU2XAZ4_9ACTN|nr:amidohydrolase family protein [Streptomyces sp. DSM 41529]MDT0543012.1 amidohydrolase family protein [Streptomyces sp. DSM 41529]